MKINMKTIGKHLLSFGLLSVLVLPAVALAGTDYLDQVATAAGIQGDNSELPTIIGNIIKVILAFLGVILVMLVIYAGFLWMTAQGDTAKVKKGKDMIVQAIVGLVIVFAAYSITTFVLTNLETVSGVQLGQ